MMKLAFQGLKTGMYYLRTRPAADPIQFTIDKGRVSMAQGRSLDDRSRSDDQLNDGLHKLSILSDRCDEKIDKSSYTASHSVNATEEGQEHQLIMAEIRKRNIEAMVCSLNDPEACASCSG
ncbi:unnamed protein product [Protopolystoma xenopodis]|uniref:Uncharacterized protein n=1 Tax=Protopolystoma xenopodis TaxID=117903 RepID=A0A3S5AAF0_9PLAT|nr:unnamed protein product [Protopolystoma xenopodis]